MRGEFKRWACVLCRRDIRMVLQLFSFIGHFLHQIEALRSSWDSDWPETRGLLPTVLEPAWLLERTARRRVFGKLPDICASLTHGSSEPLLLALPGVLRQNACKFVCFLGRYQHWHQKFFSQSRWFGGILALGVTFVFL